MRDQAKLHSGVLGWIFALAFLGLFDIAVIRKGWQSLTQVVWTVRSHPTGGPALLGFWTALSYHFFLDKPKNALDAQIAEVLDL